MKKVLMIIGGIVLGAVVLGCAIFALVSMTSSKMKCKSSVGNITIMYNDEKITGYTASGMTYDMDAQNEVVERLGIEKYLNEFSDWFDEHTDGTCKR